ncbi:MAG: outer membrane protein assembly factor BamA [Puniceicoccales bacterium]|jgi:outer membrane protein insertion porin family|nr:outer membrane protein assembly factor BamA [Puniceicoccales bacterium]
MRKVTLFFAFILCLAFCASASADGDDESSGNSGVIRLIEYDYDDDSIGVSHEAVKSRVQLEEGKKFSPFLADSSIKALYASGLFEYVALRVDEVRGTSDYKVTFSLTPRAKVTSVEFIGNENFKRAALVKKISTNEGTTLSRSTLKSDAEALKSFYNDKGYPYAEVSYDVTKQAESNSVNVIFRISEGDKFHVGNIVFSGNEDVKAAELLKAMRTKKWTLIAFIKKSGLYKPNDFTADIDALKRIFMNHGYLDVEVSGENVTYVRRGSVLDINIPIVLGKKYYVGAVDLKGNNLHTDDAIREILATNTDDVFSPDGIENACDRLREFYGKAGYIGTSVSATSRPNVISGKMDVAFTVEETGKCFVSEVEIRGNSKTKNKVILREMSLAPGDPFDITRMKNSRARLMNTGYFSSVDVAPVDTKVPERKILRVDIEEARTGKAGLGGGISTGGEVVGFVEFTQRNFDLSSSNRKLQGGGQKFRTRFQAGKRSLFADINFEEPWWYDRELAIGTDLFFHATNFNRHSKLRSGARYSEDRFGGDLYMRKHIFDNWDGKLSYSLENVRIYDIASDAPARFLKEKGHNTISKLTFSLERDTRDNFIYPTSGSKFSVDTELAGGPLFGSTKYAKFTASAIKHWRLFQAGEQVFSIIGRIGTIVPYGGDETPFFDRFYLGGSNFMKGFKDHDIGPKEGPRTLVLVQGNAPVKQTCVGGDTFGYCAVEYSIRIFDPVRFYLFAEAGFVNDAKWNFSLRRHCSDAGFGLKISIMGMPLRLDFGFPLHADRSIKHGMQFNYSFGVAF